MRWFCEVFDNGKWKKFDFVQKNGLPFTKDNAERYVNKHINDKNYRFKKIWEPSEKGLGLGKVLDYIGVKYE